jgi:hypothetical protein
MSLAKRPRPSHCGEMGENTALAFRALETGRFLALAEEEGWAGRPLAEFLDLEVGEGWSARTLLAAACAACAEGAEGPGAVRMLMAGSDLDARDADGMSPLMLLATGDAAPELFGEMVAAGADPMARNALGFDALCWAARRGLPKAAAALARHCDAGARTAHGQTPLMLCALSKEAGAGECAQALIPCCDVLAKNPDGLDALEIAKQERSPAFAPILAESERLALGSLPRAAAQGRKATRGLSL